MLRFHFLFLPPIHMRTMYVCVDVHTYVAVRGWWQVSSLFILIVLINSFSRNIF